MAILLVIIAIISVASFLNRKYVLFLFSSLLLVYNGFGVLGDGSGYFSIDLMVVSTIIILILQSINGKRVLDVRNDKVGKIIIFILIYEAIRSLCSPLLGEDTLSYSLKVYRRDLIFLFYFLFRQVPFTSYSKFLKLSLPFLMVAGIVFIDSVFTHLLTSNEFFYRTAMMGIALPVITSLFWDVKNVKFRILIILFWILVIFATEARGYFVAIIASLSFYYIFVNRKFKLIIPLVAFVIVSTTALRYMDSHKQSSMESNSLAEELATARSLGSYRDFSVGSFALRVALTFERADYLFDHPQKLLFGVGAIHEDSPNNRFSFYVGSFKTDSDDYRSRQMIDTEDVAFVSHWFRYGCVYLVLIFAFIISVIRRCVRYRNIQLMPTTLVTVLAAVISAVSCDFFSNGQRFFMIILLIGISYNCLETYLKQPIKS